MDQLCHPKNVQPISTFTPSPPDITPAKALLSQENQVKNLSLLFFYLMQ